MRPFGSVPAGLVLAAFVAASFATFACPALGSLWSEHELVGIHDNYDDYSPEIGVDARGVPWITWMGVDNVGVTDYEIFWSRWEEGSGWSARQIVYPDNTQYDAWPRLRTAARDGTPWVVWLRRRPTGSAFDLLVSRYLNGAWSAPESAFGGPTVSDGTYFGLAAEDSSRCWVVFDQNDRVCARQYSEGVWGAVELVAPPPRGRCWNVDAAMGPDGRPWGIWADQTARGVFASRRSAESGWETPVRLNPTQNSIANIPMITVDSSGEAWAAWGNPNCNPSGAFDAFSTRTVSGSWQPIGVVNTLAPADCAEDLVPDIDAGYGWPPRVTWARLYPENAAWSGREPFTSGWDSAAWSPEATAHAQDPESREDIFVGVALAPDGTAWATWTRVSSNGLDDVYSSHLLLDIVTFDVTLVEDDALVSWLLAGRAPRDSFVFTVLRSGESADTTKVGEAIRGHRDDYIVVDENIQPGVPYTYWVEVCDAVTGAALFRTRGHAARYAPLSTEEVPGEAPASTPALAVQPNPAEGAVTFTASGPPGAYALQVFDVAGRLVWTEPLVLTAGSLRSVRWSHGGRQASGVYWARLGPKKGGPGATLKFVLAP